MSTRVRTCNVPINVPIWACRVIKRTSDEDERGVGAWAAAMPAACFALRGCETDPQRSPMSGLQRVLSGKENDEGRRQNGRWKRGVRDVRVRVPVKSMQRRATSHAHPFPFGALLCSALLCSAVRCAALLSKGIRQASKTSPATTLYHTPATPVPCPFSKAASPQAPCSFPITLLTSLDPSTHLAPRISHHLDQIVRAIVDICP